MPVMPSYYLLEAAAQMEFPTIHPCGGEKTAFGHRPEAVFSCIPGQIRIPLQWSISCWMIWAVQPVKLRTQAFIRSS